MVMDLVIWPATLVPVVFLKKCSGGNCSHWEHSSRKQPWSSNAYQGGLSPLVVDVPPPVPNPGKEVLEAHDPGERPHKGGQGTSGAGPSPSLLGGGEHKGGLAVPQAQRAKAMVPPAVPGECGGPRAHALAPGLALVCVLAVHTP